MHESLPTELVILAIEHAVDLFLVEDRETLIHLAQTSKDVYAVIAPLIYYSISLCEYGKGFTKFIELSSSATPSLAERVFQYARELHTNIDDPTSLPCMFLKNIEVMHVSEEIARAITTINDDMAGELAAQSPRLAIPPSPLRRLSIWNNTHTCARQLSLRTRNGLTHFLACAPDDENFSEAKFDAAPRQWILDILELLPNLTHLAFELYAVNYGSGRRVVARYDPNLLKDSLLAALEYRRTDGSQLQVIVVRVVGQFCIIWPKLLDMMQQVEAEDRTQRVWAWNDDRLTNGENWRGLVLKDGHVRRSVWTEARAIRSLLVPSLETNDDENDMPNQHADSAA